MSSIPKSDLEESQEAQLYTEEMWKSTMNGLADILKNVNDIVDSFEKDDGASKLGSSIQGFANDLADQVSELNDRLKNQNEEEKIDIAKAFIKDANDLKLTQEHQPSINAETEERKEISTASEAMANLTEEDIVNALSGVQTVLTDVEVALRSIDKGEARELADVGLIVAKIFLFTLQSFHQSISNTGFSCLTQSRNTESMNIEVLDEDKESTSETDNTNKSTGSSSANRVRVLWPPIGPEVLKVGEWGKDAVMQKPLLAIALGMVLWPCAIITVFLGFPIVAADFVIQSGYEKASQSNNPVLAKVEQGAANLCQVGYLYFLCTKLFVKQSFIIGKRQMERRGGVTQVAQDIGSFALDRAAHPVETGTSIVNGVKMGVGALWNIGSFVKDVATGEIQVTPGMPPTVKRNDNDISNQHA